MHEWKAALAEWAALWGEPNLARAVVDFEPRFRTRLGRCLPSKQQITLNPRLLRDWRPLLLEACCHEAAHLVVFWRHGLGVRPHGPEWQALVAQAGFPPTRTVAVPGLAHRPPRRYKHSCPDCGVTRIARKPVKRWRCAQCLGELVIERL